MADKQVAVVKPVQADDEAPEQKEIVGEKPTESQESDIESESDEEIVLDEASDTENYAPPDQNPEDAQDGDDDDVSCSSGEEEEGVAVEEVRFGNRKLLKLKFEDVEAKRQEYLNRIKSMEEEEDEEEEEVEDEEPAEKKQETVEAPTEEDKENQKPADSFKEYRTATIMDEDLEQEYNSDADDDFDPVYCGETLSDVEYLDGEDRDTESEPETEPMDGSHRKTGEALMCIKMAEQLKIPPRGESCADADFATQSKDQPMECA